MPLPPRLFMSLLLLAAPPAQAQQLTYEMTLIARSDDANGINDLGQVARTSAINDARHIAALAC